MSGNSSSGGSSWQKSPAQILADEFNSTLSHNYLWSLFVLVGVLGAYSIVIRLNAHLRHLTSLGGSGGSRYFACSQTWFTLIKAHLLYAPLLFYRRAREIKITRHVHLGTVPTLFQALFILLVAAANIFCCVWRIPWSSPEKQVLPILRNRAGTLAVVNLIPMMVLASIKNPLITILNISYDTFNLIHRWLGRLIVLEAITHVLCWLIATVNSQGWSAVSASMAVPFMWSGLGTAICLILILLQSPKLVRNLAYEFFLHLHAVLAALVICFLWIHLKILPQRHLLIAAAIVWMVSRCWRLATLLYRSVGNGGTQAKIEALNHDAVKITLKVARPWTYRPGQSLYLTIPSVGLWTAHPFSVAWSGTEDKLTRTDSRKSSFGEKGPILRTHARDVNPAKPEKTISLVIKKHSGITKKLWHRAVSNASSLPVAAFVEGPYGVQRSLSSYGNVILFASGVGITHQLGYVKHLVQGFRDGTVATTRATLVWVIPSTECLDWVRAWMHGILTMEGRREVLMICLYITRAGLSQDINSPSQHVRMLRGRPNVEAIIATEANQQAGCMGVSVCAGGGLADEVRRVSRKMLEKGVNLDLMEEGFGW